MKFDKEVNEQVEEENQTQEGRAKKGTSNIKNYTSRCTGLGLHKMFAALPEGENGALRTTYFAPLLLIDPITTICSSIKFVKNYTILSPPEQGEKRLGKRHQIEVPVIGVPLVSAPTVVVPATGSSSSATEIGAVVVMVYSHLAEHVLYHFEMLHSLGSTSSLLLRKPCNASEKEVMRNNIGKRKKAKSRTKKGKEEWQKKAEEVDAPNKKKKVKGPKKEALTDEQFYHVPLIHLKALTLKIPKKGLANRVPRKRRTMVVAEVAKTYIVFFNQEKVIGEAYQASTDQTTPVSAKEQTLEVEKTKDKTSQSVYLQASEGQITVVSVKEQTIEVIQTKVVISNQEEDVSDASQTKESKEKVDQNKEEVFEGKDNDDGNFQNKLDPEQVIKQMAVDQTNV
ncbi:hypothetical protein GIB67_015943 [Kingdonia uniflora]|uniref:Uncharacterized protein n=1 Tax=Kingdonia uniflora TaxID=39325 RepID=A0A7J7PDF2_9MAGN|nr:hypothetical protein GIB67_015943 [Kingdonia uniflora]